MNQLTWKIFLWIGFLSLNCMSVSYKDFPIETSKIYGESSLQDKEEIKQLYRFMVEAIIEEDLNRLEPFIHPKLGIWVDFKSEWSKEKFLKDLDNPNGYINTYFLSTEKLRKKKNSKTAESVKSILLKSQGFYLDLYFGDDQECELDIKFRDSKELENDIIHPIFKNIENKWYIYRLL